MKHARVFILLTLGKIALLVANFPKDNNNCYSINNNITEQLHAHSTVRNTYPSQKWLYQGLKTEGFGVSLYSVQIQVLPFPSDSLCLHFLIWKMGLFIRPVSQHCGDDEMIMYLGNA